MVKVKAKIIDYEQGKTGKYHPVFEYQHNNKTLTYKRRIPMEITPFNKDKEYTLFIDENKNIIFEKTEKMPTIITLLSLAAFMMAFVVFVTIAPKYGAISMSVFPIFLILICVEDLLHEVKLKFFKFRAEAVDGTIVDFRKVTRSKSGRTYHHYFPIVEYYYQGKKYLHISNKPLSNIEAWNMKKVDKERIIYIKNETIHDEKELKNSIISDIYIIFMLLVLLAVTIILGLKPIMGEVAYYEFIIELINSLTPFKIQ